MMSLLLYDFETGFNLDNDKDGCEIWAGYMPPPPPPPPPNTHLYPFPPSKFMTNEDVESHFL